MLGETEGGICQSQVPARIQAGQWLDFLLLAGGASALPLWALAVLAAFSSCCVGAFGAGTALSLYAHRGAFTGADSFLTSVPWSISSYSTKSSTFLVFSILMSCPSVDRSRQHGRGSVFLCHLSVVSRHSPCCELCFVAAVIKGPCGYFCKLSSRPEGLPRSQKTGEIYE